MEALGNYGYLWLVITAKHILFEDNHLIAICKQAGWLSQGDDTGDPSVDVMMKAYLKEVYQKKGNVYVGLLHRLDRPVSGVLLMAKTSKAAARMTKAFADRHVEKTYHAITLQPPVQPSGLLVHYLTKDRNKNKVTAHKQPVPQSQEARLRYTQLQQANRLCLLEVHPETGRPHQIRVQLAAMGCIIAGDVKYGAPTPLSDASIALHAYSLGFTHPVTKQPITITAPYPQVSPWTEFRTKTAPSVIR